MTFRRITMRKEELTPREMQTLYLLLNGRTTKQIAQLLEISARTAKHHRRNVYDKCAVKNVAHLARYVLLPD
ncbi:MAG: helix-turn-helix transcriptional regulator [Solimonas sp.]